MKKTVLITGSSAGLGKAAVRIFAANGWNVVATMRSPEKENELTQLDNVLVTRLEVQDKSSINKAIEEGIARFGGIDSIVNNAGYGVYGPFELATEEQIHQQFNVNVFGVMNMIKAILPHFRKNKSGTIINITSMGGRITLPITSLYHASKFALEGFTESLAYELAALNITVKLVEPGAIATGFDGAANITTSPHIKDYDSYVQAFLNMWSSKTSQRSTAEEIADVIYEAASDNKNQLRYIAGQDAYSLLHGRQSKGDQEYVEWMRENWSPTVNGNI